MDPVLDSYTARHLQGALDRRLTRLGAVPTRRSTGTPAVPAFPGHGRSL
ncbi:hypothetical protein V5H98_18155 [Georgenia sp. M64]